MSGHHVGQDPEVGQAAPQAATALRWTTWAVVILAAAAIVLPGEYGLAVARLVVGVLIAAPALRVLWLAGRWFRRGDHRYAWVAISLAATIVVGAALGHVTGR